jgi:F-type H+-transporting ATPase subunit epsilon
MAVFHFELVSPEKLLFSGDVEAVVVPGSEGEFTMLKNHAPLMTTLRPGIVTVDEADAKKVRLYVRGGFAEVSASGLTILAEEAIPFDALDASAIDAQIKDLEEDVEDATTDAAKRVATEKLAHLKNLKAALKL